MKKIYTLIFSVLTLASSATIFSGGTGTALDPYQIANLSDLQYLSENNSYWSMHFIQTADIDATATSTWNVGNHDNDAGTADQAMGFIPIGNSSVYFTGSYNGGNFKIQNLFINRPKVSNVGLFGKIDNNAIISNVTIENCNITGEYYIGGIIGLVDNNCTTNNCKSSGTLTGSEIIGGLIGYNLNSTVSNSSSSASVSGSQSLGGFIGALYLSTITNSYSSGSVNGTMNFTGGFTSDNNQSPISNCYATGNVTCTANDYVGGFIGYSRDLISNCYSTGLVTGNSVSGGFAGVNSGTINNSFYDTEKSGKSDNDGRGVPKSTFNMQLESTFLNATWDFVTETTNGTNDIWKMGQCNNSGYPVFSSQTVINRPTITSYTPNSRCGNGTVNLAATASAGTLNWFNNQVGGTSISTLSTFTTSVLTSTTSFWVETIENSCSSFRTEVIATINTFPTTTVTQNGNSISVSETGATYKWLDCDNSNAVISGATNQSYTPTVVTGNFAVEVTKNGCTATSSCFAHTTAGINDKFALPVSVYPNPTDGKVTIDLESFTNEVTIEVTNLLGEQILKNKYSDSKTIDLAIIGKPGIYFITISSLNSSSVAKIIKN